LSKCVDLATHGKQLANYYNSFNHVMWHTEGYVSSDDLLSERRLFDFVFQLQLLFLAYTYK